MATLDAKTAKEQFLKENEGAVTGGGGYPFLNLAGKIGSFVTGTLMSIKDSSHGEGRKNYTIKVKESNATTRIKDGEETVDGPVPAEGKMVVVGANKQLTEALAAALPGAAIYIEFINKKKITGQPKAMNVFDARYKNSAMGDLATNGETKPEDVEL